MKEAIKVLDHGFVRLVDSMPSEPGAADNAILDAARVSYQSGTKTVRDSSGLIRYLMRNWHTSPFEMVELKFHIKMPIFVARQWMRHRTASINEISGRYSILPEEVYLPEATAIGTQSKTNKQGREQGLDEASALRAHEFIAAESKDSFAAYSQMLEDGVAREQARLVLPVNTYTEFYWKANLLNTMRLLQLRMDPHAQQECREYANALYKITESVAPVTMKAFTDYWTGGRKLSRIEWALIKERLSSEDIEAILAKGASLRGSEFSGGEMIELERKLKDE